MVNSDIPAGTYIIRPKDAPQDSYLTIGPHTKPLPPPDAIVDLGDRFAWELRDTNTDTTTVHAKLDGYRWIIKDEGALFVSVNPERATAELNFRRDETNNEGFVFIDNPGIVSSRLTYHKHATGSEPIFSFQEANNSSAQLFKVERIYF